MRKAEHSGGEVTAALVPTEVCSGLTLFQIEETITLLAESAEEEGLTPEIEQALAAYLQGVLEKRDRVAEFVLRVRGMALRVLDYFGVSKLEGRTHTLTKRKCPRIRRHS